jgi:uncharacterized protein
MPNIDHHVPGSFCWIELGTTDQSAAKRFYGSLFGWTANDFPMGPSAFYTMFQIDGRDAAAGYTLRPDMIAQGVPPHWMLYVAVESVDQAAARAAELGGRIEAPPFDVFEAGRMAVMGDPTGAVFSVWQPKLNPGTRITGVPGTLCWADLSTTDPAAASRFYSGLFGWKVMAGEKDPSGYLHIQNGEAFIGGIPPAQHHPAGVPPHWLSYFLVADVDASAARAKELGAKVLFGPMTMEDVGRWAVVQDPQGAAFAIFKPKHRA